MEVKNPLFKEDFSASVNNIAGANSTNGHPPPYSSVNNNGSPQLSTKSDQKPTVDADQRSAGSESKTTEEQSNKNEETTNNENVSIKNNSSQ